MPEAIPVHVVIAHALRDQGVKTLYGLMGDSNIFMVDHYVRELKGRYVPAVHESGAVLMALGHASATGEVGAVTITHGPALSNAVTALIEGAKAQFLLYCSVATHLSKILITSRPYLSEH